MKGLRRLFALEWQNELRAMLKQASSATFQRTPGFARNNRPYVATSDSSSSSLLLIRPGINQPASAYPRIAGIIQHSNYVDAKIRSRIDRWRS